MPSEIKWANYENEIEEFASEEGLVLVIPENDEYVHVEDQEKYNEYQLLRREYFKRVFTSFWRRYARFDELRNYFSERKFDFKRSLINAAENKIGEFIRAFVLRNGISGAAISENLKQFLTIYADCVGPKKFFKINLNELVSSSSISSAKKEIQNVVDLILFKEKELPKLLDQAQGILESENVPEDVSSKARTFLSSKIENKINDSLSS